MANVERPYCAFCIGEGGTKAVRFTRDMKQKSINRDSTTKARGLGQEEDHKKIN